MRKLLLFLFVLVFLGFDATAQEEFDNKLSIICNDIATKISNKGIKRVAVSTFTDLDRHEDKLGKYIAEEFVVNLSNSSGNFELLDRSHFQQILAEHKLKFEGLIDPATAKELGKWVNADVIITGNFEILTEKIRLTVKVIDIKTTLIIAASRENLSITPSINKLINSTSSSPETSKPEKINTNNEGSNGRKDPRADPIPQNKDCQTNTGDICFKNNTSTKLYIDVDDMVLGGLQYGPQQSMILQSGETKCFYNCKASIHIYHVKQNPSSFAHYSSGQIKVEKCTPTTIEIR